MSQAGTSGSTATSQGGTGGSTSNQGGAGGCPSPDFPYAASCNPGDQQMTTGPGFDASGLCPSERECYTLQVICSSIVCLLPEGVYCSDVLSCNPGDTPTLQPGIDCVGHPSPCYTKYLCTQSLTCRNSASPYGGICSGTPSDGGVLETPDASADGSDAGRMSCCGDGTVDTQYGEQCDLGEVNGACFDVSGNFAGYPGGEGCPSGTDVICTTFCTIVWVDPG
jgi:hypothetical protein